MANRPPMTRLVALLKIAMQGIWFRAAAFTLSGVVLAVGAALVSRFLPSSIELNIGQDAVEPILGVLSTTMLAVTTFSLTVMVQAYSSAASAGTPRSTQLLVRDRTSQNALSTFVGAFAFSIVGIVALSLNIYNETGRSLLFFGALIVIAWVMGVLLRWISFLTSFGRMSDIINRVEHAAHETMHKYEQNPFLGANPWSEPPAGVHEVCADEEGSIVWVDVPALQRLAAHREIHIWVNRRSGARTGKHEAVAYVSGEADSDLITAVQRSFVIESHRTHEQDPRFGVIVLSEISSRAMSASVNDPGTSIIVLGALQRVLSRIVGGITHTKVTHDRVYLPEISAEDFSIDAFRPTARDAASTVEVAMRLQTELGRLMRSADQEWNIALRHTAEEAFERAKLALPFSEDIRAVSEVHAETISISDARRDPTYTKKSERHTQVGT